MPTYTVGVCVCPLDPSESYTYEYTSTSFDSFDDAFEYAKEFAAILAKNMKCSLNERHPSNMNLYADRHGGIELFRIIDDETAITRKVVLIKTNNTAKNIEPP
jgi:hypothetical protein